MKNSIWAGIGLSVGTAFLLYLLMAFTQMIFGTYIFFQIYLVLSLLSFIGLIVWAILLIVKYKKERLGVGILVGIFVPPLIVGACGFIMFMSFPH